MNEFSEQISVWVKVGPNQTTGGGELSRRNAFQTTRANLSLPRWLRAHTGSGTGDKDTRASFISDEPRVSER